MTWARVLFIATVFGGLLAAVLLLGACAAMPMDEPPAPAVMATVTESKIPVPVPCAPQISPEPAYPDTREAILAAPFPGAEARLMADPMNAEAMAQVLENLRHRVRLLAAGWPIKNARIAELAAALKACG
jgi:hypothetical protein